MEPPVVASALATAVHRRRIAGVLGSGTVADASAAEVGHLIASLGYDLLTGGGGGVMEAVSRAFFETPERRGVVIGVLPGRVQGLDALEAGRSTRIEYVLREQYPNPWVEVAICTHLPDSGHQGTRLTSRNHINVLSADVLVALPGGAGTAAEIWLATQYRVPIIAFGAHRPPVADVPWTTDLVELRGFLTEYLR